MMIRCTRCNARKSPAEFYASQPRSRTCMACVRSDQQQRNRERIMRCQQNREYARAAIDGRIPR
jgi:hypothetical protein